jgi:hypothetical protein
MEFRRRKKVERLGALIVVVEGFEEFDRGFGDYSGTENGGFHLQVSLLDEKTADGSMKAAAEGGGGEIHEEECTTPEASCILKPP